MKPSYFLLFDHRMKSVVLLVRGTQSVKVGHPGTISCGCIPILSAPLHEKASQAWNARQDMFTSMTSASKPHHVVDGRGVVLGHSHFGMLASARWIKGEVSAALHNARASQPNYALTLVGHSMGAGTAAMLTMMCATLSGMWSLVLPLTVRYVQPTLLAG